MNEKPNTIYRNIINLLIGMAVVLACGLPAGAQTPPTDDPPSISLPKRIEPTADPRAAGQIEKALQGDASSPLPAGTLGDVIDIIRKRGSVLDGSSLDPRLTAPAPRRADVAGSSAQVETSFVTTAEALLRSARMLEALNNRYELQPKLHSSSISVAELVRQMRIQATRLLAAEFPEAVQ